jgi:hypothetical protein
VDLHVVRKAASHRAVEKRDAKTYADSCTLVKIAVPTETEDWKPDLQWVPQKYNKNWKPDTRKNRQLAEGSEVPQAEPEYKPTYFTRNQLKQEREVAGEVADPSLFMSFFHEPPPAKLSPRSDTRDSIESFVLQHQPLSASAAPAGAVTEQHFSEHRGASYVQAVEAGDDGSWTCLVCGSLRQGRGMRQCGVCQRERERVSDKPALAAAVDQAFELTRLPKATATYVRGLIQARGARKLDASRRGLGDAAVRSLRKVLQRGCQLESLNLWSNGLGDQGACEVAHLLLHSDSVREVNLGGNAITAVGAEALLHAAEANPSVRGPIQLLFNQVGALGLGLGLVFNQVQVSATQRLCSGSLTTLPRLSKRAAAVPPGPGAPPPRAREPAAAQHSELAGQAACAAGQGHAATAGLRG